jgi:MFS family permease
VKILKSSIYDPLFLRVIFNTLFGLSVKYWMAIATRFLLGALNGMLAPIKAYSIEVCRPEHQALGLSIVSTGWGVGLVVGPAIGGYFAQPAKQYPNVFSEKSIFGRFPYFLPCLCISLIALVVLISCIWLPVSDTPVYTTFMCFTRLYLKSLSSFSPLRLAPK